MCILCYKLLHKATTVCGYRKYKIIECCNPNCQDSASYANRFFVFLKEWFHVIIIANCVLGVEYRLRLDYGGDMSLPYVHEYGGTGKTIVLLHGFLGSSTYWSRMAPNLVAAGYKVLAIDLLGFGKSHKPEDANYDYKDHTEFIEQALVRNGIHSPFVLVGHSMGAVIAKRFALAHHTKIERLVLLHPPLYRDEREARTVIRGSNSIYRFLLDSRYRDFAWSAMSRSKVLKIASHTKRSRERSLRNIIEKAEALSDLIKLKTKTLLVVGSKDRPQYTSNLERLNLQDEISVVYTDVSHHSPLRNPKTISHLVTDFIES